MLCRKPAELMVVIFLSALKSFDGQMGMYGMIPHVRGWFVPSERRPVSYRTMNIDTRTLAGHSCASCDVLSSMYLCEYNTGTPVYIPRKISVSGR